MAYTPLTSTSVGKDKVLAAGIKKLYLKDEGANSSDRFELSPLEGGSLVIEVVRKTDVLERNFAIAYRVTFTCSVMATGTDMFTLISEIQDNFHDVTLEDFNGGTYTFTAAQFQLDIGETNEGNTEDSKMLTINGSGRLKSSEMASVYTAP